MALSKLALQPRLPATGVEVIVDQKNGGENRVFLNGNGRMRWALLTHATLQAKKRQAIQLLLLWRSAPERQPAQARERPTRNAKPGIEANKLKLDGPRVDASAGVISPLGQGPGKRQAKPFRHRVGALKRSLGFHHDVIERVHASFLKCTEVLLAKR